ncbi:dihydroorotate dehydrogenase electron transfer subunit [Kurthia senegalensis]|uniref:dihydroorotate dehydrogenase electron transfer subunit n=1 Tax=Kurthia senegalensis TaxID=1033740 RepID=UPI000288A08F|nr:dihydroorotate dehydrogenase electron transfer subunit [Kurthia senegalensis]
MIQQEKMKVVRQQLVANHIYELTLEGSLTQQMNQPGQFVHLRVADSYEPTLRRPISIANIDQEAGQFTMLYRAGGRGTDVLSLKRAGDEVDVLGPLGNGFPVEETAPEETALLIGGGIGVPPLHELSKRLNARGVKTIHVLGFRSEKDVFYEEAFNKLGETYIVTEDGSSGHQGFVTTLIEEKKLAFDTFYTCGPTPMLRAIDHLFEGKKGFLSFEERMGCGIGACYACVCDTTDGGYKKVCSDGPVFPKGVVAL